MYNFMNRWCFSLFKNKHFSFFLGKIKQNTKKPQQQHNKTKHQTRGANKHTYSNVNDLMLFFMFICLFACFYHLIRLHMSILIVTSWPWILLW